MTACATCCDAAATKAHEVTFWRISHVRSQWITNVTPIKKNEHVSFQTPNHLCTTKATIKYLQHNKYVALLWRSIFLVLAIVGFN